MRKILLLLLLAILFAGCKKDENENSRIAGKWVLENYQISADGVVKSCNDLKLVDKFEPDGMYFGFLSSGIDTEQTSATYSLKGDELIVKGWREVEFKVHHLSDSLLIVEDISNQSGIRFYYDKYNK